MSHEDQRASESPAGDEPDRQIISVAARCAALEADRRSFITTVVINQETSDEVPELEADGSNSTSTADINQETSDEEPELEADGSDSISTADINQEIFDGESELEADALVLSDSTSTVDTNQETLDEEPEVEIFLRRGVTYTMNIEPRENEQPDADLIFYRGINYIVNIQRGDSDEESQAPDSDDHRESSDSGNDSPPDDQLDYHNDEQDADHDLIRNPPLSPSRFIPISRSVSRPDYNPVRPFVCPRCPQEYEKKSNLVKHCQDRHPGTRCNFPHCGTITATEHELIAHFVLHQQLGESEGLRPEQCPWPDCGKVFSRADTVQRCIKRHNRAAHRRV
ncbi:hypothetical protein F5Y12DRAFT_741536 [Xylaria sp. FL1777]|nr:hypothetical protein F5Y12DRAFT_741536 [Xylaria sp. FL1777]